MTYTVNPFAASLMPLTATRTFWADPKLNALCFHLSFRSHLVLPTYASPNRDGSALGSRPLQTRPAKCVFNFREGADARNIHAAFRAIQHFRPDAGGFRQLLLSQSHRFAVSHDISCNRSFGK